MGIAQGERNERERENAREVVDVGTLENVRAPWLRGTRGGVDSNHSDCVRIHPGTQGVT